MDIKLEYNKISAEIIDICHTIHNNPELSFYEVNTTKLIKDFCKKCGLQEIDTGMSTGAVFYLDANCRTTVALRCDIDAISAEPCDNNGYKNKAHNCGHDFHTASLLACAKILSNNRAEVKHNVVFIFQPAEEVTQGAGEMLRHGLLERLPHKPDMLFGIHNRPEADIGKVIVYEGALMAAKSNFTVTLEGKAGHGGQPHECIDPIVCAASLISSIQTVVSRNTNPLEACVCTVCSVHGGTTDNQAPELVTLTGSIRALNEAVIENCANRLKVLTENIARAYMCKHEINIEVQVPPVFNSKEMYRRALKIAVNAVGEDNITDTAPVLGSEDFAVFGKEIPSFFYWVGSGTHGKLNPPWHNGKFHIDDEYICTAAKLYIQCAIQD